MTLRDRLFWESLRDAEGRNMASMIERVARAICRAGISGPKDHLDEQENRNWRKFVPEARAAIKAMRDPTEAMLEAVDCGGDKKEWLSGKAAIAIFQRMIDGALKE